MNDHRLVQDYSFASAVQHDLEQIQANHTQQLSELRADQALRRAETYLELLGEPLFVDTPHLGKSVQVISDVVVSLCIGFAIFVKFGSLKALEFWKCGCLEYLEFGSLEAL